MILEIKNIECFAHHGCLPEENIIGQRFSVDVDLTIAFEKSLHSDALTDTADYVLIHEIVRQQMNIKSNLIENAAWRILQQLKKLGCSLDWDRTSFTMDDDYYDAVIDVFIDLFNKGHIYRGVKMINWDPKAKTALSNEEVIFKEQQSKLFYIKYYFVHAEDFIINAQGEKENFLLDERRTRDLMRLLIADNRVQLILIEPHLEKRLGFANTQKVRTPPCESVRHDDHIHVTIY